MPVPSPVPSPVPALRPAPVVPAVPELPAPVPPRENAVPPARRPAGTPVTEPSRPRPARVRPVPSAPAAARRTAARRQGALVWTSGLLVVTVTVAGLSLRSLSSSLAGPRPLTTVAVTAAASGSDEQSGAGMSIVLTGNSDGTVVSVRATVSELRRGRGYRLYGYTYDGREVPVVNWTGNAGVQDVAGELPAAIADLSHFTVTTGRRKPVVTVYLPRAGGPNDVRRTW